MLNTLLQISLCWGMFYLLYWFFFRQETFFQLNRFYLLMTLFLGLILPNLELNFFSENSPITSIQYLKTITIGVENWATEIVVTPHQTVQVNIWNWETILWSIYSLGFLFLSIRFLFGLWKIFKLYQTSPKSQLNGYQLIKNKSIRVPFSFFNLLFWNEQLDKNNTDHQKILQHECAHIRQFHSIDVLILEILCIFFWWNPLVWFYKKSIRTIHEYLADEAVLQTTKKKQYGQLLIRQSHSGMQVALANNFTQSQLKNRIMMMMKSKSNNQQLWKYLFFLPAFGMLFTAFSCQNVNAQSEEKKHTHPVLKSKHDAYKVVEEMPRFAGAKVDHLDSETAKQKVSNQLLIDYLIKTINYPTADKKSNVEGKVVVNFIIDKTGQIKHAQVIKSDGTAAMETEALRVITEMPTWTPGKQKGKQVGVEMTLPISFKLPKEQPATGGIHESSLPKKTSLDEVDVKPYFPGCDDLTGEEKQNCSNMNLLQFIYTNIKYPKAAQKDDAEGTVLVKFIVTEDGSLENPILKKSVHPMCDAEVLRVVNEMPLWTPAYKNGKAVAVEFTLPVKFKLEGEKKEETALQDIDNQPNELDIQEFKSFPNPASDKLTIQFKTAEEIVDVKITDANGQCFLNESFMNLEKKNQEWESQEVDISNAARGVLLITMTNDKGDKQLTKKVILQ